MYRGVRHILFRPGRRPIGGGRINWSPRLTRTLGCFCATIPRPGAADGGRPPPVRRCAWTAEYMAGHRLQPAGLLRRHSQARGGCHDRRRVRLPRGTAESPRQDARVIRLEDREHGLAVRTIKRRLASVSGLFASLVARGNAGVTANPVPGGKLRDELDLVSSKTERISCAMRSTRSFASLVSGISPPRVLSRCSTMPRHGTATCRRAAGGPSRVTRRQTRCYTGCANQPST
jgi:hypothetical protein